MTPHPKQAFVTEITAACESWASENLPLEYSYGVAPASESATSDEANSTAVQVTFLFFFTTLKPGVERYKSV